MFGSMIVVPVLRALEAAVTAVGHELHGHDLLVIRAIVVHQIENRNLMMRGRPQHAVGHHEIAIGLNANAQPPVLLVG
jgi:hypothetical protein